MNFSRLRSILRLLVLWTKKKVQNHKHRIKLMIALYFGLEFLFFCRWLYLKEYVCRTMPHTIVNTLLPINMDHEYMNGILNKTIKYAKWHPKGFKGWALEWFNCDISEIRKQNMLQLIWNGFFIDRETNNTLSASEIKWRESFVDKAYNMIEKELNFKLAEGYNNNIALMMSLKKKGTFESVNYHPLIVYIFLHFGRNISDLYFYFVLKFEYQWIHGLKVWYKLPKNVSKDTKPILLIHGIGSFLSAYIPFIHAILTRSPTQPIICIEIPWICISLNNYVSSGIGCFKHRMPSKNNEYINIMKEMELKMVTEYSDERILQLEWTLIGHSYGTFVVSDIYKYMKQNISQYCYPRLVLLDPCALCLSQPNVTILSETVSKNWKIYLMQSFALKELQIACHVQKHFYWFQFALYPDDLINDYKIKHIVGMATHDPAIPFSSITQGIDEINRKYEGTENGIKKIVFENKGHAEWLISRSYINQIVDALYND